DDVAGVDHAGHRHQHGACKKKGEYIHLAKFDDYVSPENDGKPDGMVGSKRPLVDGIKFMVIPDASTVKAGLQSGVLDTAEISQDLIP
ncbi:hypothetical protein ACC676_38880, partial [Rhizobium ruizarguesonis]